MFRQTVALPPLCHPARTLPGIILAGLLMHAAGQEDSPIEDIAPAGEPPSAPAANTPLEPIPSLPPVEGEPEARNTSEISGEVSDSITLDPLAGAIVSISETGLNAETDVQGRFRIQNVPAGNHTIEVFKLGYFNEVTTLTTLPGQASETRVSLRGKPVGEGDNEFTLEEETVIGEYQESSGGDLFLGLDAGSNLVSGVSKEQFTQMAVSDAAGAVSKIAGANIVGGKYAVVRGLGDRYSNTLVNGALVSSADPSKKAVQLDLFPSDLLQSVAINKTATADLPAEFAGGIVLLQTLRLPDERIVSFEMGIESNSNLGKTFYKAPEDSIDFWGGANENIPLAGLPAGFLSPGHTGTREPSTDEEKAATSKGRKQMERLHSAAGMRPKKDKPKMEGGFDLTYGDSFELRDDLRIGGVFSFTYENGDKVIEGIQIGRGFDYGDDLAPGSDGDPANDDFVIRSHGCPVK